MISAPAAYRPCNPVTTGALKIPTSPKLPNCTPRQPGTLKLHLITQGNSWKYDLAGTELTVRLGVVPAETRRLQRLGASGLVFRFGFGFGI